MLPKSLELRVHWLGMLFSFSNYNRVLLTLGLCNTSKDKQELLKSCFNLHFLKYWIKGKRRDYRFKQDMYCRTVLNVNITDILLPITTFKRKLLFYLVCFSYTCYSKTHIYPKHPNLWSYHKNTRSKLFYFQNICAAFKPSRLWRKVSECVRSS